MASSPESAKYAQIHDGDAPENGCNFRVSKALLAVLLTGSAAAALVSSSFAGAVELQDKFPYEVMPQFEGRTKTYGGYGLPSGGRFAAKLQHLEAGSRETAFLLDHRMQYIVDGEIHITDGTGQTFVGKAGDLFYLAYGSNVTHYTPKNAITYVSIADEVAPILPEQVATLQPEAYRSWILESAGTTEVKYFPQVKEKHDKVFGDEQHLFFNAIGCWKWNAKGLPSNLWTKGSSTAGPHWNFCCGVFHLKSGPPQFTSYTYKNHEELDFVIDGEFDVKDGDGQKLKLEAGDLVHNPRHKDVHYATPSSGVFISTSLSPVDDFFPTQV